MERELDKQQIGRDRLVLVNATQVVDMADSGIDAVREKKDSSMSVAAKLVRDGECQAVVSAGHTGAAVAAGTIIIGRLPGVDFPGIASPFPNEHGTCYVLDAGANPDAKPEHLVQYAIMGSMLAKHVHGQQRPIVGLMNIGEEDGKGQRPGPRYPALAQGRANQLQRQCRGP